MRVLCQFGAASVIACILAGCATIPTVRSVTVELFDSPSVSAAVAPSHDTAYALDAPTLPEVVPATASVESASVVAARLPPESVGALFLPEIPTTVMKPDLGFLTPPSPRARAVYVLAIPDAPSAGPTAAAAAKPAASSGLARATIAAQPRVQAASGTPPTSAQGRASTVQPAAAGATATPAVKTTGQSASAVSSPSSSGSASAGATGGTAGGAAADASATTNAPAQSYGTLREIYARTGDQLQVGLDGLGFLFLGFPDKSAQADGISFKTKENRNNKTWFTFQALQLGTYDLDFVQQDNTTGKSVKETVRVHVVSDQDFSAATQTQSIPDAAVPETGDPAYADTLTGLGQYQAAVAELMKGYRDGNPSLNDRIAALYMHMNSYDAAAKFYTKNLAPQNQYTASAVDGLMRVAVVQKDQQALMADLKQFLALKDSGTEETFIMAARMERDTAQIGVGLQLLATYATRFPTGSYRDEADLIAAQMLEADSTFRNIAQARDLYNNLLTNYPESAFADAARQRVQYIDRHFIHVR